MPDRPERMTVTATRVEQAGDISYYEVIAVVEGVVADNPAQAVSLVADAMGSLA